MDLDRIEAELKKRWHYPYSWHMVQNDRYDTATRFIFRVETFDGVVEEVSRRFGGHEDYQVIFDYTITRWYNRWSAAAVEEIFKASDRVKPALDQYDRLVDFEIDDIKFDHKTSVFPKRYSHSLSFARSNPADLIRWLYKNQSQQGRKHFGNRLFIVTYSGSIPNWKLKAEIKWLQPLIEDYLRNFSPSRLHQFDFKQPDVTLSDIIWAIK